MRRGSVPFKHPWVEALVGEVADVVVGGTPSTAEPSLWNGEIRWMVSGDVHQRHIFDVPGRISEAGLRWSNAAMVEPKAVAMALAGQGKTRGAVALTHVPICTNQSIALIKPKDERLDPEFLYQSLIPRYEEMRARSAGGGRAGLTKWILEQLPLQLPPPIEQRRIAEILSTVDEVIEQTEALIAKYRQIKAGLMHDLFTRGVTPDGHLRPICAQAPHLYKQSPLGWIPKEWEVNSCSEICEKITVGIVIRPTQYYVSEGIPAFRSANVRESGIDPSDLVFISRQANALLAKSQLQEGDVISVRTGYPGTSAVVSAEFAGANCIDLLISRPSSSVRAEYLAYWINSSFGKDQVLRKQGGLAQQHFNVGELHDLLVVLPKMPEQNAILDRLSAVSVNIENEQSLVAKLRQQKHGLMHDLLTGRVRVKVAEPAGR